MLNKFSAAVFLAILCGSGFAQSAKKDPRAIVEIGGATGFDVKGGTQGFGPNVAAEVTPIEHWLEIEAGTSALLTSSATECDTDILFKKPWTLNDAAEFMLGTGPEWVRVSQNGQITNAIAAELAADFMFWPRNKHKFGWYLEPAYDYAFDHGHEQSIGISGGLLIAIP